ncbi:MAG: hypothetical protein ACK4RT_12330 [Erythrobacter sp.]
MNLPPASRWQALHPGRAILPVWLCISAMLALASPHLAAGRFPDADDAMRLVQVRDLMGGQDWFDLHQYRMNPPAGTLMHWSRLVDLPLAGLIGLLAVLLPPAMAELAAVILWPLLLLLASMAVVGRLASERLGPGIAVLAAALFALVPMVPAQFQPLRIDHHGWQILTVALALWAVFRPDPARGGLIAGLAMATGLMISLETVVMAAGFALLLTWRWLVDDAARVWLVRYLQGLAGGLVVLFLLLRGLGDLAPHCDVIAPAHLGLFAVAAAGATILAAVAPASRLAVLAGLAVSGLIGVALVGLAAPACLASPFAGLDPLVRDQWYLRVTEGMPLWHRAPGEAIPAALQCLLALAIALHQGLRGDQACRRWWREYALVLAVATIAGFATFRSIAFAGMIATIPLAWLLARVVSFWRSDARLPVRFAAVAALLPALMPAAFVGPLLGLMAVPSPDSARASRCEIHRHAQLLDRLPAGLIFAPLDIGPDVLLHTRHSIVASGHHRAAPAMRDVVAAFTGDERTAHALITANRATYVLACTDIVELSGYRSAGGPQSFAALLAASKAPAWLEPVALGGPEALRLWKVVQPAAEGAATGNLLTNP